MSTNKNEIIVISSIVEAGYTDEPSTTNFVTCHAQIVRNPRIPCPHWTGKEPGEKQVVVTDNLGITTYTVGKVEVTSSCEPTDDKVIVRVKATGKGYYEDITIPVPYAAFKVLGLFGIGERLNTNVGTKSRSAFLTTCFALVNGGYSAQYAKSYLAETAAEKAAREERERAELAQAIDDETKEFVSLACKVKGISQAQKEWLNAMPLERVRETIPALLVSTKWVGLMDKTIAAGFKHLGIVAQEQSDYL